MENTAHDNQNEEPIHHTWCKIHRRIWNSDVTTERYIPSTYATKGFDLHVMRGQMGMGWSVLAVYPEKTKSLKSLDPKCLP